MELPANYVSVQEILNLEKRRQGQVPKEIKAWSFVNFIGVIVDRREPKPTSREDWKAAIKVVDISTDEEAGHPLEIHLFFPEKAIHATSKAKCGDILVVNNVKVQTRNGDVSVMTNQRQTKFALFAASKIPAPPHSPLQALVPFFEGLDKKVDKSEADFVSHLHRTISRCNIPEEEAFIQMSLQSKNTREKFRELCDVKDGIFCDLVVQVVRKPFEGSLATTLWVSDYTENPAFYDFPDLSAQEDTDGAGSFPKGQISMQISCFDEHMDHIRELGVTKDTWITIKNVQIIHSRTGSNLEGKLRGSRGDPRDISRAMKISVLNPTDREDLTPRHKAALERRRDRLRAEKRKDQLVEEAAAAGRKRKANGSAIPQVDNAESRRRAKRAAKKAKKESLKAAEAQSKDGQQANTSPQPGPTNEAVPRASTSAMGHDRKQEAAQVSVPKNLNTFVKCESPGEPAMSISTVTEYLTIESQIGNGQTVTLPLPFVNRKYRMDVRAVNFDPPNLEDFAYPKRISHDIDLLSNDGGSEIASDGEDSGDGDESSRVWEWRFWLQLEDATSDANRKQRFWVLVDHQSAQCLMNLDVADNLKENKQLLQKVRESLFILWGDLEDVKAAVDTEKAHQAKKKGRGRKSETPPPHSDDEDVSKSKVSNRPFSCCIEQYGVKVPESNDDEANAGHKRRWQRVFRLDGTRIAW